MLTLRPDGASVLSYTTNYEHCVPNKTGDCRLLLAYCFLLPGINSAAGA